MDKDLTGTDFLRADLDETDFRKATLENTNFREAEMRETKLGVFEEGPESAANVRHAIFNKAKMRGRNAPMSILRGRN